ncbi:MAG: hypothetical protein Q8P17_02515 [bacterium]|nr:hypothetical protein [bacterium]
MRWIAISGSGRGITPQIEQEVRDTVRQILERGDGIVTGGVLGVDYISTDEALAIDPTARKIKVCLPASFNVYLTHFKSRADISKEEGLALGKQLQQLRTANPAAIIEVPDVAEVTKLAYEARNDIVLTHASKLMAFSVNKSKGTEYTVQKARALGMSVDLREYSVPL